MPLIQVTMVEGRTTAQKEALIRNLSDALAQTLEVPLERVRVAIYEVGADSWGIAGEAYSVVRGPSASST